jgi:uroporphyrinogen-III decarboxylase
MDTQHLIMSAIDKPGWMHRILQDMLDRQLAALELDDWSALDLIETGGGAGSSTVISPKIHREFCLPYDRQLHDALHKAGTRAVYHLCGGLMPLLDMVAQNGADGIETMTPPSIGGDCDLAEASRRVGDGLFFIGGFDQNAGFERGTPDDARRLVRQCFEATREKIGAYICSPSDHFFFGDPENVEAFFDEAAKCIY